MVNGVDTTPDEYPFHTQVGCCSGALIAPDIVLSAGHDVPPDPVGMTVTVGAFYSSVTAKQGDPRSVTKAFMHPQYDSMHNDFCILVLDKPSDKQPVRINRSSNVPKPHQQVGLLGTGTYNLTTSDRSEVLQKATAKYIPHEECAKAYDPERGISYAGGFLDDTNLCTKGDGDGCVFDSGGPVIVEQNVLVGLISFGVDCGDPIYPAVNSRVSAVHEWIDSMVCEHSVDPPKDFACGAKPEAETTWMQKVVSSPKSFRLSLLRSPTSIGMVLCAGLLAFAVAWRRQWRSSDRASAGELAHLLDA
jgi:secreted trypsin-like serine protease